MKDPKASGEFYTKLGFAGFMYSRGFRDLDGHLWNALSMNAGS